MNYNANHIVKARENINININNVLKNTYILLSLTMFFSALAVVFSIKVNAHNLNIFIMLAVSFGLLFLINIYKNSYLGIIFVFAFTGFLGYTMGPILNYYLSLRNGKELILFSLLSTGMIFSILSLYVLFTKKNFDFLGGFLYIGFFIILACIIVNFFINMPVLHLTLSGFMVIIFSLMILYDTSKIVNGGETNYILATISIYLNIYNLFLGLLSIFNFLFSKD